MALEDDFLEVRLHEVDPVTLEVKFSVRVRGDKTWIFMDDITMHAGSTLTMTDGEKESGPGIIQLDRETWTEALRETEVQ